MTGRRFDVMACGDDALRILCGPGGFRHDLAAHLSASSCWIDIVPGKQDVTAAFDPHVLSMAAARALLLNALETGPGTVHREARVHPLDVVFSGADGPDLAQMAERLGLMEEAITKTVEGSELSVDMLGFTPGFAYLTGLDPALIAARLVYPRPRVPAGSVGLITGQIGLYALDGPGGWPIIGRVQQGLFDRTAADPFRLRAGDRVVLRGKAGA